ncbi:MAG: hypothetical protein JO253_00075 [Alphaproteobacteria bacterium]|nr:hypothetical protein [Alphaproteobacteria bacterium]
MKTVTPDAMKAAAIFGQQERKRAVIENAVSASFIKPTLRTINACGFTFCGGYPVPGTRRTFAIYAVVVLWFPILPLGIYYIEQMPARETLYKTYGAISPVAFLRVLGVKAFLRLVLSAYIDGLVSIVGAVLIIWAAQSLLHRW